MARAVITVPSAAYNGSRSAQIRWQASGTVGNAAYPPEIPATLREGTSTLRPWRIIVRESGAVQFTLWGGDMSSRWETHGRTVLKVAGVAPDLVLVPESPPDTNATYAWGSDTDRAAWYTAVRAAGGGAVEIEFSDGLFGDEEAELTIPASSYSDANVSAGWYRWLGSFAIPAELVKSGEPRITEFRLTSNARYLLWISGGEIIDEWSELRIAYGSTAFRLAAPTETNGVWTGTVVDERGTLSATLANAVGADSGATAPVLTFYAAIAPRVTIEARTASIQEGQTATFRATMTPYPTDSALRPRPGFAITQDGDWGAAFVGDGAAPLWRADSFRDIQVSTTKDETSEDPGSITVSVRPWVAGGVAQPYVVGDPGSATAAIMDATPTATITSDGDVDEGDAIVLRIAVDPVPESAITVVVATVWDSSGNTFGNRDRSYNVAVGTDGAGTLTISTLEDPLAAPGGSVTATIQAGTGYAVGDPDAVTVAVADRAPILTVEAVETPRTEGQTISFRVRARNSDLIDGDAGLQFQYRLTQSGRYIDAGNIGTRTARIYSDQFFLTYPTQADNHVAADGTATLELRSSSNAYRLGSPASATIAILNDDLPRLSVAATRASVTEGQEVEFVFSWDPAPLAPVTVNLEYVVEGNYFAVSPHGTTTVAVPVTGFRQRFAVASDSTDELDGSIEVYIRAGDGYVVGTEFASVLLRDDDAGPLDVSPVPAWYFDGPRVLASGMDLIRQQRRRRFGAR